MTNAVTFHQPSGKKRNLRYDTSIELSGLALNIRKQTSPEQSRSSPNVKRDKDGRYTLVVGAKLTGVVENSYDHEQTTKLIDDSNLSPESRTHYLNPYIATGDTGCKRFSSSKHVGFSPAGIKLEPVQVVAETLGFVAQTQILKVMRDSPSNVQ